MTKSLYIFLLTASAAYGQLFSYGIKGGVPLTDFIDAVQSQGASSTTNRYIVGPTGEVHLPFGLSVEADVLYRHFNYQMYSVTTGVPGSPLSPMGSGVTQVFGTTANAWEFPILAKYRFKGKIIHPFVDAGVSWDTLSGVSQTASAGYLRLASTVTGTASSVPANSTTRGFVTGGGIDLKVLLIHITPEIRYTRWGAQHFIDPSGLLHSNQSQAEFLVGFTL